MKSYLSNKVLLLSSIIIAFYFTILFAIYYFKIEMVLIGVVAEMTTIPFILAQLVLLPLLLVRLFRKEKENKIMLICAFVISLATTLFIFRDSIIG